MESRYFLVTVREPELTWVEQLTPKERLVHDLLVFEGLTDGEMADRLGMTERAVKFHVQNLLQKTQAPDRFKMAVAFWRAWSDYDAIVDEAPPPVRRRGAKESSSARGGARRGHGGAKKSVGKKKASGKKASPKKERIPKPSRSDTPTNGVSSRSKRKTAPAATKRTPRKSSTSGQSQRSGKSKGTRR